MEEKSCHLDIQIDYMSGKVVVKLANLNLAFGHNLLVYCLNQLTNMDS